MNVLLGIGYLPPLLDDSGKPHRADSLPCTHHPEAWDEEADAETQHNAARVCHTCPALTPCRRRAFDLDGLTRGVWGGVVFVPALPPVPAEANESAEVVSQLYDATVAHLLHLSGVELRPQRSHA